LRETHRRHLRRVRVLRRRRGLHSLRWHLTGSKVLVLHSGRWSMGEALLEAELGLLGRRLGARQGRACRVAFLRY